MLVLPAAYPSSSVGHCGFNVITHFVLAKTVVFALAVVLTQSAQPQETTAGWTERLLHSFDLTDGNTPSASLIFDAAGNLYARQLMPALTAAVTATEMCSS
jgi:hypothetical protein